MGKEKPGAWAMEGGVCWGCSPTAGLMGGQRHPGFWVQPGGCCLAFGCSQGVPQALRCGGRKECSSSGSCSQLWPLLCRLEERDEQRLPSTQNGPGLQGRPGGTQAPCGGGVSTRRASCLPASGLQPACLGQVRPLLPGLTSPGASVPNCPLGRF